MTPKVLFNFVQVSSHSTSQLTDQLIEVLPPPVLLHRDLQNSIMAEDECIIYMELPSEPLKRPMRLYWGHYVLRSVVQQVRCMVGMRKKI